MFAVTMNAAAVVAATIFSAIVSLGVSGAVLTPSTNNKVGALYVSPLTSWFDEMRNADGLDLGAGLTLHLETVNQDKETKSLLERRAIRLDFNGIGMRIGKAIGKDSVDVGFYADGGEARDRNKHSDYLLHALFGFNLAGMVVFTLAAFGLLVMKSLAVAKIAFVVAAYMMIKKVFGGGHSGQLMRQSYELIEPQPSDLHPGYIDYNYSPAYGSYGYPPSGGAVNSPNGHQILSYSNYGPTGANGDAGGESSNVAYAIADPAASLTGVSQASNFIAPGLVAQGQQSQPSSQQHQQLHQQQIQRRRDIRRKPHKPQHVTVNKYSKVY